ncbi:MAG: SPFH domain-containing protein [candidate division Zixibacteria bacterium]|nr:SPFH domain-containing protein [candidate division Zixibacteria bacterium]MBU1471749.1 SPFH domain-containing protein [candidate division Zixibacteria bacterium]MBU2625153.1 SPFH domain-containing protein [candidate division Zixibacteria bacterium]
MGMMLEVIEWVDLNSSDMIHRIPEEGSLDIKLGAQAIVRESQTAVFFSNGRACDVLGPGRHTLTTLNVPILTRLLSIPWGFKSPFRAEVYFVNHKVFTNLKWGTRDPVAFRDSELGLIRLRGHGAYTCQIKEPMIFLNRMVGHQALYGTHDIEDYLRDVVVARINDFFGENLKTIFDLPEQYTEMAAEIKNLITDEFAKYGLDLIDFYITSITPPDEVQRMIDEKSGMSAVGDLDHFLKYEMAKAFGSSNAGGYAGAGAGIGMGAGVGLMAPMMMSKALAPEQTDFKVSDLPTVTCSECGADTPEESRFCYKCGHQMVSVNRCGNCSAEVAPDAVFCQKCGNELAKLLSCPDCGQKLPGGTKFCFNCGRKMNS